MSVRSGTLYALLLSVLLMTGCSTISRATNLAGQVAGATASSASGLDAGTVQTVLATFLSGVTELLRPQREFWLSLMATIETLDMMDQAATYGIPAAVIQICALPSPEDIPEDFESLEVDTGPSGDRAILTVSGYLGENRLPIVATIDVGPESSIISLRGGGWLLCGISESEIELDGELLDLGDAEELQPEMSFNAWPENLAETGEPPTAVEIELSMTVDNDVVTDILTSHVVVLWLADEPVELTPESSEAVEGLLDWLLGPVETEPLDERFSEQDLS